MIRILYIEDEKSEIKKFTKLFSKIPSINFSAITPSEIEIYFEENKENLPDLFLVDYRLNLKKIPGIPFDLYGASICSYIRERIPNYPIILATQYPNIEKSILNLFDYKLHKNYILKNPNKVSKILVELSKNYRLLRETKKRNRMNLFSLMKTKNTIEEDLLIETTPPLSIRDLLYVFKGIENIDEKTYRFNEFNIVEVTKWILETLFHYPGILYNSMYSAALLGLSHESFLKSGVQEFFNKAKYTGIYSKIEERWWKNRLETIAYEYLKEKEVNLDLNEFLTTFSKDKKLDLKPSKCIGCNKTIANTICYILNEPTRTDHSIRYFPDDRPAIMEIARVSYKAILEGKDFTPDFVDKDDSKIVESVESIMKEIRK